MKMGEGAVEGSRQCSERLEDHDSQDFRFKSDTFAAHTVVEILKLR